MIIKLHKAAESNTEENLSYFYKRVISQFIGVKEFLLQAMQMLQ